MLKGHSAGGLNSHGKVTNALATESSQMRFAIIDLTQPVALPNHCFLNAYLNKRHVYKHLNLRQVYGSLAYWGWFEFGGKKWGLRDFRDSASGFRIDAHSWLEDAQGNIYDCVFPQDNEVSKARTRKPLKHIGLVQGQSYAWAESKGFTYVPAPEDAQTFIRDNQHPHNEWTEKSILAGNTRVTPDGKIATSDRELSSAPEKLQGLYAETMADANKGPNTLADSDIRMMAMAFGVPEAVVAKIFNALNHIKDPEECGKAVKRELLKWKLRAKVSLNKGLKQGVCFTYK